jgi:hypothetical protein
MDSYDQAATDREALARYLAPPSGSTSLDGEDLINIEDVIARISDLEAHDCHRTDDTGWCADYKCASCDDGSGQELTALRGLLAEMEPVKAHTGRASAIRDSYLETFVRDEIEDVIEGLEYVSDYIDWDELTADRRSEMTETTFGGTTYYITS